MSTVVHTPALRLQPAMPYGGAVEESAVWVGLLDLESLEGRSPDGAVRLDEAFAHRTARLLLRSAGVVVGYATLPIRAGSTTIAAVRAAIGDVAAAGTGAPVSDVPVSVVICTRDRPDQLDSALASVLASEDGAFEVVVVDNAPATDATRRVIDAFSDPRVRYVLETRAGLATARNTGMAHARHEIVAFTDDDVIVDGLWLRWLRAGFASGTDVACVSGLVPSGELRNDVQRYFDARVSWSKTTRRREFRLADPPSDLPMFPFCVGEFGTGANFAVRRSVVLAAGGFDEALGVGTRTRGGEDIDMFVRLLDAGHALVVEPSAFVWHRHRAELDALRHQAVGYGTGLGAWLTKVALSPRLLAGAVRRAPAAVANLVRKPMASVDDGVPIDLGPEMRAVGRLELRCVLAGPAALLAERGRGRSTLRSRDPRMRTHVREVAA